RLQNRISVLERLRRLAGRGRRLRRIDLEHHRRAIEREPWILRHARPGAIVFAQGTLGVILGGQGVPAGDVFVRALVERARCALQRLLQSREHAGWLGLLRDQDHALRRGEQKRDQQRAHARALRRSGPSPRAAAAQSSAKAGHANQGYLSSYWTVS